MPFINSVRGSYGAQGKTANRNARGLSQSDPAISALAVSQNNPSAQPGWYWLNINGIVRQYWVDTQYQGGGWVLVMNSISGNPLRDNGAVPTYSATTGTGIVANSPGSYGQSNGRQSTRFMVGLGMWEAICVANGNTSTKNMLVMTDNNTAPPKSPSGAPKYLNRFTWTGMASRFFPTGVGNSVIENQSGYPYSNSSSGLYSYHLTSGSVTKGWQTADNKDGNTCVDNYDSNPWWYGGCWDGNIWGGASYGSFAYYQGSNNTADNRENYGAVYIK